MHCSGITAPRFGMAALVINKIDIPPQQNSPQNERKAPKRYKKWALKHITKTQLRPQGPLRDFFLQEIIGGKRSDNRITLLLKGTLNTITLAELTGPTAQAYASTLARRLQPSGDIKKLASELLGALTGNSRLNKKARKTLLRLATHDDQRQALEAVLASGTNSSLHGLKIEQDEPILVIDGAKTPFDTDNSRASASGKLYLDRFLADA